MPETSWLWLATQFLAHDFGFLMYIYISFLLRFIDFRVRLAGDRNPDNMISCCSSSADLFSANVQAKNYLPSARNRHYRLSIEPEKGHIYEIRERRKIDAENEGFFWATWKVWEWEKTELTFVTIDLEIFAKRRKIDDKIAAERLDRAMQCRRDNKFGVYTTWDFPENPQILWTGWEIYRKRYSLCSIIFYIERTKCFSF